MTLLVMRDATTTSTVGADKRPIKAFVLCIFLFMAPGWLVSVESESRSNMLDTANDK